MNGSWLSARHHSGLTVVLLFAVGALLGGCASKPPAVQTGFLSDYSRLEVVGSSRMRYVSPKLAEYDAYIVDPVHVLVQETVLSAEDRAEVARYFREAFVRVAESDAVTVTDAPGVGVARVRLALTGVAKSTWWKKVHPVSRAAGAGTGGAAMEGEVVDSLTGEQLGAVVQAGTGNQFDLSAFSTLADVKSVIDDWAEHAATNVRELRSSAR